MDIFQHRSIQIVIMAKWLLLKDRMLYFQFLPHMCMLGMHLLWHVQIRPYRTSSDVCRQLNTVFAVSLIIQVSYFMMIEILQMYVDFEAYIIDILWNVIDTSPLMTVYFQIILAVVFDEEEDE
jgi:hypothetical protein